MPIWVKISNFIDVHLKFFKLKLEWVVILYSNYLKQFVIKFCFLKVYPNTALLYFSLFLNGFNEILLTICVQRLGNYLFQKEMK